MEPNDQKVAGKTRDAPYRSRAGACAPLKPSDNEVMDYE